MRSLNFARHFALGALAAGVLIIAACASPRTASTPGDLLVASGTGGTAAKAPDAAPAAVRNLDSWGQVTFVIKWPTAERQVAYMHQDTFTVEVTAYDGDGAIMKDAGGVNLFRTADRPSNATSSTLTFDLVPSGSVRFDAVAKSQGNQTLATGSATASIEGNTTTSLRLILGLPGKPKIYSFNPTRGFPGFTSVSMTGDNFTDGVSGGLPSSVLGRTLLIGGVTASPNYSNSQLMSFQVPAGAQDGPISFDWTMSGINESVTSTQAFTVISGVSILGSTTVSRGSTFSLSATGSSASSASFALTANEANIMRIGSTCNPACDGTNGQPQGSNAFTIIPTGIPGEFMASGSGTASVTAGGGTVTATVSITVNP